jgi:acetyl-CoA synthetase
MNWRTIEKPRHGWAETPNLLDYQQTKSGFSWEAARRELDGLPGGRGLNIAHEAVDRHLAGPRRNQLALRWLGKRGEVRDFTYADLHSATNRFANVLRVLGIGCRCRPGRPPLRAG